MSRLLPRPRSINNNNHNNDNSITGLTAADELEKGPISNNISGYPAQQQGSSPHNNDNSTLRADSHANAAGRRQEREAEAEAEAAATAKESLTRLSSSETTDSSAAAAAANPIERRYLIRRPRAHQWFEHDVLMKASARERVAGRFELFYDLLYVALIANFAEKLAEEPSGLNLVIFIITFTTAWHVWADEKENANNYYNDDLIQRVNILWIMILLILFGNNANYVAEDIESLRITVATYQVIRFTQACMFLYNSFGDFRHRAQNRGYVLSEAVVILLWTPMYFEDVSGRAKIANAFVAILVEEIGYILTFGPWIGKWLGLTHRSALDINHEADRHTAFTIIVLGEFTYAILVGSPARGGINLNYLRAVFTLVIAFCFNAMYVYGDGSISSMHPARWSVFTSTAWLMIHLPMSAGLLIGGHVAAGSTYEEMSEGRRWLLGGGLAVGYLSLWILSYLFKDCDARGKLLMPKFLRTLPRLIAAIVMALLPLTTTEQLSDTGMLGVATALSIFCVVFETSGSMERGACFFESWKDEK